MKNSRKVRIISLFNQAGGVGKSTLTMNLGYHLAISDKRVLLIDLDPQASLTLFMGLAPNQIEKTIKNSILDKEPLPICTLHGMDLVPSNILFSAAEQQLSSILRGESRLKQALSPIKNNYDFILIDSPPTLGILSILGLVASDYVLIPSQTHFKSTQGTDLVLNSIAEVRQVLEHDLKIAGLIPNLYTKGTIQDLEALEFLKSQLAPITKVYPPIPRSTAFADASQERQPLAVYNSRHPAVTILDGIAKDLEELL
ncbi:ParA family protein (plasmid) [Acaryochloris sp. 'Moss Beach']|uniref:ParA family protein n=1 Tax=Acaryochloris TaxID=155977 RepID=UPI001BAF1305|nr:MULTISPECIES: ParA family protein [Acaryochloris]QUY45800.1 ParA family protein [Acaryochloris marina S15]UJB72873.1 ParA family protein [Acaryochloris sp. 'Moss Beach']